MTSLALLNSFRSFAQTAAPFLHIRNDKHYKDTLELIENLLEEAEDSLDDPINSLIDMLSHSISAYEDRDEELVKFEARAMAVSTDLAVLRILMEQHQLSMAELPEIGSKSMVSRVLSGERELSKKHIQALSQRFHIDPGLFF